MLQPANKTGYPMKELLKHRILTITLFFLSPTLFSLLQNLLFKRKINAKVFTHTVKDQTLFEGMLFMPKF